MGVLDGIFNGNNGVDCWMHETFGGTAVIHFKPVKTFNDRTCQWETSGTESTLTVPFLPLPRKEWNEIVSKSILEKTSSIAGSVPYCKLTQLPVNERDTIVVNNKEYKIIHYEVNLLDDSADHVIIYGTA